MQGLRPVAHHQDENSLAHFPPNFGSKLSSKGEFLTGKATAVLPGQRKALGNITNRGFEGENPAPSKTPSVAKRRALGDITNSSVNSQLQRKAVTVAKVESQQSAAAATGVSEKAALWAEEGVERLAGKDWQELESDRQRRVMEEIDERMLAFSMLSKRSIPNFFPCWVSHI